jgi:N4-gp56 family major capsid protein
MLELTAIDNTVLEAIKLLGKQAGATLDTVTRNVLQSGTNVSYCPKIAADGTETPVTSRASLDKTCVLTVKAVQQAVAKLKAQNAPKIDGKYVAIVHPYAAYDLMRDPEWVDIHKYGHPVPLYAGELGEIAGVRFVESTEAKIYAGEGCPNGLAVFGTLFLGEGAYGVTEVEGGGLQTIVKQKGSSGTADPLDQRSSVGWKAIKTAEILIPQYIVRVESCSPEFSETAKAN